MTTAQPTNPSNKVKGDANLETLRGWLDAAERVPERNGAANISAIAIASGVDRQVLYRPEARRLIADAVAAKGLGMPDQQRAPGHEAVPGWATQRIKHLEEQLAVAKAETHDLRARLRRYEHLEAHMTATGMLPR